MIIKSLLSQDLYKLSMLQVFFSQFPDATAKYRFKCRNKNVDLLPFKKEIEDELDQLCTLKLTTDELDYLDGIRFFSPAFVNYMEDYTLKRRHINVSERDGKLDIVMEGSLTNVSMFEIVVLKIVQEVYMRNVHPLTDELVKEGRKRLIEKIASFKEFEKNEGYTPLVAEFGGRRGFSVDWHEFVTKNLNDNGIIIGTSDVDIARKHNIKPIGSMAHEFITMFQAFTHPMNSQKMAFETWLDFYGNDLNVLLSDTLGDKLFLLDMTPDIANRSGGARHDSGCPFQFGEMMIAHYNALNIDPTTKTLIFSDGLDFPKMFQLEKRFHGRIKTMYGIGTHLSNDMGIPALQNVCKQISVNNFPTCKMSNNPDKTMCENLNYLSYLKNLLDNI